jgi:hypothetical protein
MSGLAYIAADLHAARGFVVGATFSEVINQWRHGMIPANPYRRLSTAS